MKIFLLAFLYLYSFRSYSQEQKNAQENLLYKSEVAIGTNAFGYSYLGYEYLFKGKEQWSVFGELGLAVPLSKYTSGTFYSIGSRWFTKRKGKGLTLAGNISFHKGSVYREYQGGEETYLEYLGFGITIGYTLLFDEVFSIYPYLGSGLYNYSNINGAYLDKMILGGLQIGFRL